MKYDKYYEYIVVGIGGIGSGTLFWLAKKAGKGKDSCPHLSTSHPGVLTEYIFISFVSYVFFQTDPYFKGVLKQK